MQLAPLLVGLLWGLTNPLLKRGSAVAAAKTSPTASWPTALLTHLTTPAFVAPHALNQLGGLLFIVLLGSGSSNISALVPSANAASVVFTAIADLALGERLRLHLLLPGLALLAAGILLCTPNEQ
jgi:hypothetical protein